MLERVALVYRAYGGNGLPELPVLCWFANAPALRRLAFTEPFSPSRVLAPWPRLTHLKITSSMPGSIRECVTILPLCKALEHFVAQMYKVEVEGTLPVVEVPTLRTMALRRDAYKIGHYLRAPRLNRLTIRSESAQSDLDTMVAIASRGPLLELHHLSVKDPSVDALQFGQLLERLPALTHLDVDDMPSGRIDHLDDAATFIDVIRKAPRLRALSLQLLIFGGRFPEIVNLVDTGLPHLERLNLYNSRGYVQEEENAHDYKVWIEHLRLRGLHVETSRIIVGDARSWIKQPREEDWLRF